MPIDSILNSPVIFIEDDLLINMPSLIATRHSEVIEKGPLLLEIDLQNPVCSH